MKFLVKLKKATDAKAKKYLPKSVIKNPKNVKVIYTDKTKETMLIPEGKTADNKYKKNADITDNDALIYATVKETVSNVITTSINNVTADANDTSAPVNYDVKNTVVLTVNGEDQESEEYTETKSTIVTFDKNESTSEKEISGTITIGTQEISWSGTQAGKAEEGGNEPEPDSQNMITVSIDGANVQLDADKTYADNGYYDLFSANSYTDYYNDSEESFRVETNGYPQEGDGPYYTTCEYQSNMVTVTIDDETAQVDANKIWSDNDYFELYTTYEYNDPSKSSENYAVDVNTYPVSGESYYTYCDYAPEEMEVSVDGEDINVDSNKTWAEQEQSYSTMYCVDDGMADCINKKPVENKYYSTESITVYINGVEHPTTVSPYYGLLSRGYFIDGKIDSSGWNDYDEEPAEDSAYYSTESITVTIDGNVVTMSPYYTFEEHGYTSSLYTANSYSDYYQGSSDDYEVEYNKKPIKDKIYFSSCEYAPTEVNVTINGEEKTVDACKTWRDNGYSDLYTAANYNNWNIKDNNDFYRIETGIVQPKEGDVYYTSCEYQSNEVTVTLNGGKTTVDANATWFQLDYEWMFDLNNNLEECQLSNPVENGKYSTEKVEIYIDGESKILSPNYTFAEQGIEGSLYCNTSSGSFSYDIILCESDKPLDTYKYTTVEPTE